MAKNKHKREAEAAKAAEDKTAPTETPTPVPTPDAVTPHGEPDPNPEPEAPAAPHRQSEQLVNEIARCRTMANRLEAGGGVFSARVRDIRILCDKAEACATEQASEEFCDLLGYFTEG